MADDLFLDPSFLVQPAVYSIGCLFEGLRPFHQNARVQRILRRLSDICSSLIHSAKKCLYMIRFFHGITDQSPHGFDAAPPMIQRAHQIIPSAKCLPSGQQAVSRLVNAVHNADQPVCHRRKEIDRLVQLTEDDTERRFPSGGCGVLHSVQHVGKRLRILSRRECCFANLVFPVGILLQHLQHNFSIYKTIT